MIDLARRAVTHTGLYHLYTLLWNARGRRPPDAATIVEYAQRYRIAVFVETGTYLGNMLASVIDDFSSLTSIELDPTLARRAAERFRSRPKVRIVTGDSSEKLAEVLGSLREPALFWLDAHYSGGVTARGALDTPIVQELKSVLGHEVAGHVVLIDDAKLFGTDPAYPTIPQVEALVRTLRPSHTVSVADDVIRIAPAA